MYLAVNKKDKNDFHAFTWTHDSRLIIGGVEVSPDDWEIIGVEERRQVDPLEHAMSAYLEASKKDNPDIHSFTKKLVGDDAYSVFIMFEALYKNKFLDFNQGLDSVWSHCTLEYGMFRMSDFDRADRSEYDCIHAYVRNLGKPISTGYNGEPCKTEL